jgi:hypothetical protein
VNHSNWIMFLTFIGGVVLFGLFLKGSSLEECEGHFVRFAEKTFSKPRNQLMSVLTDSRYGAGDINEALKEAFGVDCTLLDWSGKNSLIRKIAVTATTTDTSTPCIFANYSGEGHRLAGMRSGVSFVESCDGAYGFGPCRQESRISTR